MNTSDWQIALVGAGRMGTALLRGWLAAGIDAGRIEVVEPKPTPALGKIAAEHGFEIHEQLPPSNTARIVVLAVKPQSVTKLAEGFRDRIGCGDVVISIMAGIAIKGLRSLFPDAGAIVRAMPSLAAAIREGMTVAVSELDADAAFADAAEHLLARSGAFSWLKSDDDIDIATAISGSGPAYVYYFAECITEAAIAIGFDRQTATLLTNGTMQGAVQLLASSGQPASELRDMVTSPGGTTEAALTQLTRNGTMKTLLKNAAVAAAERSRALSEK